MCLSFINLCIVLEASPAGLADPASWQLGHVFIIKTSVPWKQPLDFIDCFTSVNTHLASLNRTLQYRQTVLASSSFVEHIHKWRIDDYSSGNTSADIFIIPCASFLLIRRTVKLLFLHHCHLLALLENVMVRYYGQYRKIYFKVNLFL